MTVEEQYAKPATYARICEWDKDLLQPAYTNLISSPAIIRDLKSTVFW
jgi:hypothetical protein